MELHANDKTAARIAELERLINEFKERFKAGTSDIENFMTMSEIEELWRELQSSTNNIYSDMVRELMSTVDERELIRKKKDCIKVKE